MGALLALLPSPQFRIPRFTGCASGDRQRRVHAVALHAGQVFYTLQAFLLPISLVTNLPSAPHAGFPEDRKGVQDRGGVPGHQEQPVPLAGGPVRAEPRVVHHQDHGDAHRPAALRHEHLQGHQCVILLCSTYHTRQTSHASIAAVAPR